MYNPHGEWELINNFTFLNFDFEVLDKTDSQKSVVSCLAKNICPSVHMLIFKQCKDSQN